MKKHSKLIALILLVLVVCVILGFVYIKNKASGRLENVNNGTSVQGRYEIDSTEMNSTSITVTDLGDNKIKIEGTALWTPSGGSEGSVHTGELEGIVEIHDGRAIYKDDVCQATLVFTKNKLSVEDNYQCGGFNVTFTGGYSKK